MRINKKKTQLLVISPRNGYTTSAAFDAGGEEVIRSIDEMKVVGFYFRADPGVGRHVLEIHVKFWRRVWMLYHLRKAGLKGMKLFKLYCCYVRSVVEYCTPVYYSLLNQGQAESLEKLQRQAIRICFGFEEPAQDLMNKHRIESLESRRVRRTDRFITKAASNPQFAGTWLRRREEDGHNLRSRRAIAEERAALLRRFRSPLFYFRLRANELGL